jgi:hypothetical protein
MGKTGDNSSVVVRNLGLADRSGQPTVRTDTHPRALHTGDAPHDGGRVLIEPERLSWARCGALKIAADQPPAPLPIRNALRTIGIHITQRNDNARLLPAAAGT